MNNLNLEIPQQIVKDATVNAVSDIVNLGNELGAQQVNDLMQGNSENKDADIADLMSIALNLTGVEGLSGLGKSLEGFSQKTTQGAFDTVDQLIDYVLNELLGIIGKALDAGGVLETTAKVIDVTNTTVQLGKKGIEIASSALSIAANAQKLANQICGVLDPDIQCIPSVKDSASIVGASLKAKIEKIYYDAKTQLMNHINAMICTSSDSITDNIIISVNAILNEIDSVNSVFNIDSLLKQYTGFTISEIRYLCNTGFNLIGMIQRSVDIGKQAVAQKKAQNQILDNSEEQLDNAKQEISDNIDNAKEKAKTVAKEKFEKLQQDFSKEEAKAKLFEWLGTQSILLQNAFKLVVIKDYIRMIKDECEKMSTNGIQDFADFLNVMQIMMDIFDLFGYVPGKSGITIEDLKGLATSIAATAVKTFDNVVNQITENAQDAISNIQNSGSQTMNDVQQSASQLSNQAQDDIQNELKPDIYEGQIYDIQPIEYNDEGNVVNITLYADPLIDNSLTTLFKSWKSNGKAIFNNIKVKQIKDNLQDIWDDKEDGAEFAVSAKENGLIQKYIFKVSVDSEQYDQWIQDNKINVGSDQYLQVMKNNIDMEKYLNEPSKILRLSDLDIDMSLIEQQLDGKVLMFDFIVKMLDLIYPLYEVIKQLAVLYQNYMINKEFVKEKQHVNLGNALKDIAQIADNLKGILSLENTNFFAVRTKAFADTLKQKFDLQIGQDGMATIGIGDTIVLKSLCSFNHIEPECELDPLKGTTLYFADSVNDDYQTFKDGSSLGISNIVVNTELGEIYYDPQNRPTIPSQIMRAMKNQEDPYRKETPQIETKTVSESQMQDMFRAISVHSDEFEGQQSINLSSLDLCAREGLLPIENGTTNFYEIIEFGDEYTNGEKVAYKWNVKPGQHINEKTVIAYIIKDGKHVPIKSKYINGVVKADGKGFFHLYPDSCNDHICIADTSIGDPVDFDMDYVKSLADKMAESGSIFNLLVNNLIPSMLPVMLKNADRKNAAQVSNCKQKYEKFIDDYNKQVEKIGDDIKKACSSDKVKETKGDIEKIKSIGDQLNDFRDKTLYNLITNTFKDMSSYEANGVSDYSDCEALAYESNNYEGNETIGYSSYNNYYLSLLANVKVNENDVYSKRFFDLIDEIASNRIDFEGHDINDYINDFNNLYKKEINAVIDNAYYLLDNQLNADCSQKQVYDFIKRHKKEFAISGKDGNIEYDGDLGKKPFSYYYGEYKGNDEQMQKLMDDFENALYKQDGYKPQDFNGPIGQLSNMFMFIRNYIDKSNNKTTSGNAYNGQHIQSIRQLIESEADKILNFWNDLINTYNGEKNVNEITKELKRYCSDAANMTTWPTPVDVNIGNDNYKVYTFTYPKEKMTNIANVDLSDADFENVEAPYLDASNFNVEDAPICDINKIGDTTITDYLYWATYMANATLFTLIPAYWADGFDIPPYQTPLLLPAIYFPIAPPIQVPMINVVIVTGLAIRGIWVSPIILIVNETSHNIDITFPAMIALEQTKQIFSRVMTTLENGLPALINEQVNLLIKDNEIAKKTMDKFKIYADVFKSIPIEDKALIEEEFMSAVHDEEQRFANEKERRKAERAKKKRDKRQVVTRSEYLGTGEEPF